jgi:elongation factor 1-gamma
MVPVFSKAMPLHTMVCMKHWHIAAHYHFRLSQICFFFVLNLFVNLVTVANAQLRGNNDKDAALIQQFINFADNEILPSAATWVFPTYGIMQYNKQVGKQPSMSGLTNYLFIVSVTAFHLLR